MYETPEGEEFPLDPKTPVSMNCWGFAPRTIFPMLKSGFEDFIKRAAANQRRNFICRQS